MSFIINVLNLLFSIFVLNEALSKELFKNLDSPNINTSHLDNRIFLIDDFCNIGQSQIIIHFFQDIFGYFNSSDLLNKNNDKCLILDNIFNNYYFPFGQIQKFNKESFIYYTCPICQKDFKTNSLLNLHYKLFHMKYNESLICPGDFCMSINCNRYYDYFDVKKFSKSPQDVKFNRQPVEKDENCVEELIFFYKSNCMKLIEGCFGEDKDKYYRYYKYICNEIKCKNDISSQIEKESNLGDLFRYICLYLLGILGIIYLIIIWLTKYA